MCVCALTASSINCLDRNIWEESQRKLGISFGVISPTLCSLLCLLQGAVEEVTGRIHNIWMASNPLNGPALLTPTLILLPLSLTATPSSLTFNGNNHGIKNPSNEQ